MCTLGAKADGQPLKHWAFVETEILQAIAVKPKDMNPHTKKIRALAEQVEEEKRTLRSSKYKVQNSPGAVKAKKRVWGIKLEIVTSSQELTQKR
ncbi:hypothetical protein C922_05773 [Plasmodium inui San Antonio 1]|uniref:Uncharacterized protein n=1 Tax=Plasmodium inui San Antonio 1 TaxID=1237626 RepID=W6ZX60_9APIC|nr:hypothetical protein C922_05773 [Plasmodium inui San Antonio 1]EUD63845.1 hypothetical protein C922_05773 [Plasmodium inui San Antonio 1]